MAETSNTFINTGVAIARPLVVRFADGEHAVPGWIIAQVGREELETDAAALTAITFEEFTQAAVHEMTSEVLRRYQTQFLAEHTGRFL